MTDDAPESQGQGDQLAIEAAEWFARMRGPDADIHRAEFEKWRARGALHLRAYNRAAEIFAMGKYLREEDDPLPGAMPHAEADPGPPRWVRWTAAIAIAILLMFTGSRLQEVIIALPWPDQLKPLVPSVPTGGGPMQLMSRLGEIRHVTLDDGSKIILDADSLLSVAFDDKRRLLRLERGRARFEVAHERRSFVVAAGPGTITATGTIFDVALSTNRRVAVKLLRGSVDVRMPGDRWETAPMRVVRLRPGDRVAFADLPAAVATIADAQWPEALADFNGAPLRDVVAAANVVSPVKIRIADPSIGAIRVSGSFSVKDGRALADSLATLFDLRAEETSPIEVMLRHP